MVLMYVKLVQAGAKTIEQVPIKFRAEVEAILNA